MSEPTEAQVFDIYGAGACRKETQPVSDHKPSGAGKRASARLRLFLPARIVHLRDVSRAMLCDLSVDGAMIMTLGLAANAQVTLRWAQFEASGFVQWADGQICGISFDVPQSWEVVLATRQEQDERGFSARTAEQ